MYLKTHKNATECFYYLHSKQSKANLCPFREPDSEALTSVRTFHLTTHAPGAFAIARAKVLKPLPNIFLKIRSSFHILDVEVLFFLY